MTHNLYPLFEEKFNL